jgi:pyridoxal phosphate enzyme (YggS family)
LTAVRPSIALNADSTMPIQPLSDSPVAERLSSITNRLSAAAGQRTVELLAVSKTQPPAAIAALASCGQHCFGENYVQEAAAKIAELDSLRLRWHLIGPLQSNKAAQAAALFDCIESVDRPKILALLNSGRAASGRPPLDILLQVNVDDEASKAGCKPGDLPELAKAAEGFPHLRVRGVMGIPAPLPDMNARRRSFAALRGVFEALQSNRAGIDTLSMGMSEDFELAIAEGATRVRVGSALFGPRQSRDSRLELREP